VGDWPVMPHNAVGICAYQQEEIGGNGLSFPYQTLRLSAPKARLRRI